MFKTQKDNIILKSKCEMKCRATLHRLSTKMESVVEKPDLLEAVATQAVVNPLQVIEDHQRYNLLRCYYL
jgi:hypothetical protein